MKIRSVLASAHMVTAALLTCLSVSNAAALDLFNTGVDSSGTPLPIGATDTHWTIISGPDVTAPISAVASSINFFYVTTTDSTWIWKNAEASAEIDSPYTFRTSFTLTSEQVGQIYLSGAWAADNIGDIKLNGSAPTGTGTFSLPDAVLGSFDQLHSFVISGGFVIGTNTLDFSITDVGAPGGLNVSGLSISPVPEVGTSGMFVVGIAAAALALRRRSPTSAA